MFSTKAKVDKYVQNHLKKCNTERERYQHGYRIAKLYYDCGEFEIAKRYVSGYLTITSQSSVGHRLLGKCLESLGRKEAALQSYRTSLEIDSSQKDLLLKVCELLASDEVSLDPSRARYWCEQAQRYYPNHPTLFTLRERMLNIDSSNDTDVEQLILSELEKCPTDTGLRIRLLRHFLQTNKISEAYKHAGSIEESKSNIFADNLTWYEIVAEILIRYQRENTNTDLLKYDFWILIISVLDKVASLSFKESSVKSFEVCATSVFNLDQMLTLAVQNIQNCPNKHLIQEFINHYRGQLCFLFATLIFKKAKVEQISNKEVTRLNIPLLLASWLSNPPDIQSLWLAEASEQVRRWTTRWHLEGSFRCSQSGHILLSILNHKKSNFSDKLAQLCFGNWREQLYKSLFINRNQIIKLTTSYFVTCPQLSELRPSLPTATELHIYDEAAQLTHPSSLHHMIWLLLNRKVHEVKCTAFDGLQYSVKNLSNCAAETLNVLDIQSFVYCATFCAENRLVEMRQIDRIGAEKFVLLPESLTEHLCTSIQDKWYKSVYKVYTNQNTSDLGSLRLTLTRGIEVVRCVGNHGIDVRLLVKLANAFGDHAKQVSDHVKKAFAEARATVYWNSAVPLLERLKNNQAIKYANKNPMFEYRGREMTPTEINMHLEEGKIYLGLQLKNQKEYEQALKMFKDLKSPYATFYQAEIYEVLASEQLGQNKENVTSEMRSQHVILLSKARDCIYLTLDRLREPSTDRKHPLNAVLGTKIENIELQLSRIDPDMYNQIECENVSEENLSSAGSVGDNIHLSYTLPNYSNINGTSRNRSRNIHSTPYRNDVNFDNLRRTEARPSPERLDAQIRQIFASRDTASSAMVDEIRSLKDVLVNQCINEIKDLKITLDNFKKNVQNDLSLIRESVEQIPMIKREMNELKKDPSKLKNVQLNEEDLYILDEDYDYNINSNNANAFNQSPLYPGFANRAAPLAYPAAANMYAGVYPMYGYPGLPFDPHLNDLRALGALPPQTGVPLVQPVFPTTQQLQPNISIPQVHAALPQQSNLFTKQDPQTSAYQSPKTENLQQLLTSTNNTPVNKSIPVNVVITASDPVPTSTVTQAQPILSVTIPPQHLKGGPIKPQPQIHNYQIPLPTTYPSFATITTPTSLPLPVSTQTILSGVAPPMYSSIPDKNNSEVNMQNVTGPIKENKPLNESSNAVKMPEKSMSLFNNSQNDSQQLNKSETSIGNISEEHDPCPDFKPIIPLPDEVEVCTGEEGEIVLYQERAKLYRFVVNEWRERGVGTIKLLKNNNTGKIRLLMRREQVHKICANHFVTPDMELQLKPGNDKVFIWAAYDFADEEMKLEKFCVRFKTVEIANSFKEEFEKVKSTLKEESIHETITPDNSQPFNTLLKAHTDNVLKESILNKQNAQTTQSPSVTTLGGFTFSSTPTFLPKAEETSLPQKEIVPAVKPSPFASFSFSNKQDTPQKSGVPPLMDFKPLRKPSDEKLTPSGDNKPTGFFAPNLSSIQPFTSTPNKDSTPSAPTQTKSETATSPTKANDSTDDFVPTAEFAPVIPLPDLVDVQTGEEDETVLFCERAKLLRFDATAKEWKERGIGDMKILRSGIIRLLMRREKILKVCCNHQVTKTMEFSHVVNNDKAVRWAAQDYSENELKSEIFTIRFKSPVETQKFLDVLKRVQEEMDSCNFVEEKPETIGTVIDASKETGGWGDLFKPKTGTWECQACYIRNEESKQTCVSCNTPNSSTTKNVEKVDTSQTSRTSGWGDKFKPKAGNWECKTCYINNEQSSLYCCACETPKDSTVPKKDIGLNLADPSLPKFNFGIPSETNVSETAAVGWGDKFKPKAGTWECKTCYISNDESKVHCIACETPKDGTVPKKESGINLSDTSATKFTFGIPPSTESKPSTTSLFSTTPTTGFNFGIQKDTSGTTKFEFGKSNETPTKSDPSAEVKPTGFVFNFSQTVSPLDASKGEEGEKKVSYTFGSPEKFEFAFTPRTQRKSIGAGDESDDNVPEDEGEHIHFQPVIPLPEKVEVKTGEEDENVTYCHRAKLFRFVNSEWKERGLGDIKILKHKTTGKFRVVMRREQVLKICLNHALTADIKYLPKDDKSWLFTAPDYSEGEINHQQFCIRFKTPQIANEFKSAIDDAMGGVQATSTTNEESTDGISDDDIEIVYELKVTPEEEQKALALKLPANFYSYLYNPPCKGCIGCDSDNFVFPDAAPKEQKEDAKESDNVPNTNTENKNVVQSIFSSPMTKTSNIFGPKSTDQKENTDTSNSVKSTFSFGTAFANNLFGSNNANTPSFNFSTPENKPTPIFSNIQTNKSVTSTSSLFAASTESKPVTSSNSIFQTVQSTPSNDQPKPSIFSGAAVSNNTSIFGGTPKFSSLNDSSTKQPLFGSLFATPQSNDKPLFFASADNMPSFGSVAAASKTPDDQPLFLNSNVDFATIASASKVAPAFEKKNDPAIFEGAGSLVFSNLAKNKPANKNDSKTGDENDEEHKDDEEYDPHYEPIVPLPEKIVVQTGEEDEKKEFCSRAKLFRFDNETKEWKERGVGEMKILYHPERNTYRFLLRREQVHKIVLNQLLQLDLKLEPLSTSDKAFCWYGMNYAEDPAIVEKLAVRFKNVELASEFLSVVQKSLEALKNKANTSSTPSTTIVEETHTEEEEDVEAEGETEEGNGEEDDDEYEDYNDDDDEDKTVMLEKPCSLSVQETGSNVWTDLGPGDIQIYYDADLFGTRICMTNDDGEILASNIIGMNTTLTHEPTTCTWSSVEYALNPPTKRTLRVNFNNENDSNEFYATFLEGVQYAQQTDIIDTEEGVYVENDDDED